MNFRASPDFLAASMLQSLQSLNNLYGFQPGSSISSSGSAFSASKAGVQSAFSKTQPQTEDDDCEIIFYEPVKKIKGGESTVNLVDCQDGRKPNLLSPQKSLSPSTQPDNGYNSSSSLSEALVEKDTIELEDDDDFPSLPAGLVMEDDVIRDVKQLREQVGNVDERKEAVDEQSQTELLAAQQRAYMQQMNASNCMAAMLYNAKLNYVRQMQAQAQVQAFSLLGKRLYEQLVGLGTQTRASDCIVLDDESEQLERIVEEKLKSKKNVFKVTKEVRKRAPKKVFTVIRQKPRVHRKIVIPRRMSLMSSVQTSTVIASTENKISENKMQIEQQPQKTSKSNQKEEKPAVTETQKRKKEVKRDDDEYVIKLHVEQNEDDEEINETPVGEEFQVKVGPFVEKPRAKKELKLVWDPSKATERNVNTYFQKLETKFGKKIVSEEFALKFYYEHKMNVKKIMAEIEGNKLYFKNFFEMKQKVLRNRVLHNDF